MQIQIKLTDLDLHCKGRVHPLLLLLLLLLLILGSAGQGLINKALCVEVLWPSQPNGVMLSAVSLPNHTFTGQA